MTRSAARTRAVQDRERLENRDVQRSSIGCLRLGGAITLPSRLRLTGLVMLFYQLVPCGAVRTELIHSFRMRFGS